MLEIFSKFVDEITQSNSRSYKEQILKKYKDNEDVKYLLNFIYNPYITTGISTKKFNFAEETGMTSWYEGRYISIKDLLEYLKAHTTGRYEDLQEVLGYMCLEIPVDYWDLYEAIITKNLQLGIDSKTINKVIPELIPEFNVQLANKYFDKPEIVEGKEFALTTKIDGGRIIAIKENGKVSFYTRAGQLYGGLVDLEEEMQNFLPDNICLDGEITLLDRGNLTSKEQYKQTMKITRKDGEKHGIKMLVFDCMTADEFRNQKCETPYLVRRNNLIEAFITSIPNAAVSTQVAIGAEPYVYWNSCINYVNSKHRYFQILPYLYTGKDITKIIDLLTEQTGRGEEGVMINDLFAPYQFKRTNSLLKVKKFNSCDLRVVGFVKGINKLENTLGALLLEYKDNIVKCGSGFTDEQRTEIWNNQDKYLNTIVEVNYFEETTNSEGTLSLRFPIFKDFRPDKTEPNF